MRSISYNLKIWVGIIGLAGLAVGIFMFQQYRISTGKNHVVAFTAERLPVPEVITNGPRTKPVVALTFDADMTPGMIQELRSGKVKSWYNRAVIETLHAAHAKATLFLTGLWAKTYPNDAAALAHDPLYEIGDHSYEHFAFHSHCYHLPTLPEAQHVEDVKKAQQIIAAVTGVTPKYFRFPGGCYENKDITALHHLGLQAIGWDVSSGDAFNHNTSQIVRQVESHAQNGSIIVFHMQGGPNAPKTAVALQQIIPNLKKRGFQFVTVSELLAEKH